jgi:hypothetical protein
MQCQIDACGDMSGIRAERTTEWTSSVRAREIVRAGAKNFAGKLRGLAVW